MFPIFFPASQSVKGFPAGLRRRLGLCFFALVLVFPADAFPSDGEQEWRNLDGVTMTAELAGYDYVTKSVIFKKSDGITY